MTVKEILTMGMVNEETKVCIRDGNTDEMFSGIGPEFISDPAIQKYLDCDVFSVEWMPEDNKLFVDPVWFKRKAASNEGII